MKTFSSISSKVRFLFLSVNLLFSGALSVVGQPNDSSKSGDYSYFKGGTISVIPSSHQDIAWMDSIGKCIEFRDMQMITPVLKRLKENAQFTFSVAAGLTLREYLPRHTDFKAETLNYTREGPLEWGATYK